MRKLPDELPTPSLQDALDSAARALAGVGDYAARVGAVDSHWKRNRQHVVDPARETLRAFCGECEACCYCDDSVGADVEHIWPKTLYPDMTFAWTNLLLACGNCNRIKNAKFSVLVGGQAVSVARKRNDPIVPPLPGDMALIDLRREDPLAFFQLDLDLGFVTERPRLSPLSKVRAEFTRETLKLNRDPLPARRTTARRDFRARMHEYIRSRARAPSQLEGLRRDLLRHPQQMVWREMQRQQARIPELAELFAEAPEMLDW